MVIQLNGKPKTITATTTLADLLREYQLLPERVVIEINQDAVARECYATQTLREGDYVELLEFVGGG